ncbi:alpha/beta fold hydrolase [Rhodocytophaga rosea]|uniref:Alpha/beta fold hydrolase n=2 Tax=Rhodocytophaga rosea TaxID=2704465 RepID=A0A6C0GUQ9_9BACT|nr:alpha/beta fold hydrolase [Rhodocytophaga rosea]
MLLTAAVLLIAGACSKDEPSPSTTFVLVHGAWQGPYVWQYVKEGLEKKGHKVLVVELPAHGNDNTSPANVSMDSYRDKVIEAIHSTNGKVVLVGHSLAGMVISATAEKIPSRINKLVYLAAFIPVSGQNLLELASADAQSQLGPSLVPSADGLTLDIKSENRVAIFCQDGSETNKKLLIDNFRVEPAIPFGTPVSLTDAAFGKVAKYYIYTTEDKAIGIDLQKQMASAAGISKVYSVTSGHSPFLSTPDALTGILLDIVK